MTGVSIEGAFAKWKRPEPKLLESGTPGVELWEVTLANDTPQVPEPFSLVFSVPKEDTVGRWTTSDLRKYLPPNWASTFESCLARNSPVVAFFAADGGNRFAFAVSEAKRTVKITAGVHEVDCRLRCRVEFFTVPEAPLDSYRVLLRIDRRPLFFGETLAAVTDWFAAMPEYRVPAIPEGAFEPLYSSWYSYHQNLFDHKLEAECALAAANGMTGIIVDDGWQGDDNSQGYRYCGDWEISLNRFSDMRAHVKRVHDLGLRYLVWYSVPFAGELSQAIERFRGKLLDHIPRLQTAVLDPRFPEVREYLISIYEKALIDWDIDGFKFDFIDRFAVSGEDPALKDNYAGRDIKTVPEAVDVLLSEVMERLRKIKPEILIEFRQSYIGPAIRKFGNMFRAGDCPADALSNRVRTIDLRLSSGNTAVHADMLEWSLEESAESAALQFLAILFAVPQISVRQAELPAEHREMLRFYLKFWCEHRETLLRGSLRPLAPELNYPIVYAAKGEETVAAVYAVDQVVRFAGAPGSRAFAVNATPGNSLVIDCGAAPKTARAFDARGRMTALPAPGAFARVAVPPSGFLELGF